MASDLHGLTRTLRNRTEEQKLQELGKIKKYHELEEAVRAQAKQKNTDPADLFALTSKLLRLNPEYYTVWNVRRRCLTSGLLSARPAGSTGFTADSAGEASGEGRTEEEDALAERAAQQEEKDQEILRSELGFTIPLLMEYPKCYWLWNHRRWLLQQATERLVVAAARRIWEEELGLVGKMLERDRRNFHAWSYRRYVVARLESPELRGASMVEPEFAYTTKKISSDLSNFSAWHNRTRLIPRLLRERNADSAARKSFYDAELSLVREALNVGPDDQSLWYYHHFLMLNLTHDIPPSAKETTETKPDITALITPDFTQAERARYLAREIEDTREFLEDYADVKWIYEVLVEYTLALARLEAGREPTDAERDDLRAWLRKLRALDPMRNGRWGDLERENGLS